MPTYTYECVSCKHRFEEFHSMSDERPRRCPKCRRKARRVPASGAGLLFKGSGFHITDYRSASYRESAKQEGGGSEKPKSDKGPEKPKSDKKSGGGTPSGSGS